MRHTATPQIMMQKVAMLAHCHGHTHQSQPWARAVTKLKLYTTPTCMWSGDTTKGATPPDDTAADVAVGVDE